MMQCHLRVLSVAQPDYHCRTPGDPRGILVTQFQNKPHENLHNLISKILYREYEGKINLPRTKINR